MMTRKIYLLLAIAFCFASRSIGQRIEFAAKNHVTPGQMLSFNVLIPFDTVNWKFPGIDYYLFSNDGYKSDSKIYTDRDTAKSRFKTPLTRLRADPGIHSFFFQFPDGFGRCYSGFVNEHVDAGAANFYERIKIPVTPGAYNDVFQFLKTMMDTTDGGRLIASLPVGLKAIVCIDFWGLNGFTDAGVEVFCTTTQYLISTATATPAGNTFFATLINGQVSPAVNTLLSGGWQMNDTQFNNPQLLNPNDLFVKGQQYLFLFHRDPVVNDKIKIGYTITDKYFRRILIFVNN